jgi:hypothetical protein
MITGIEVTGPPAVMEARARLRALTPPRYRWWRHVALVAAFVVAGAWLAASHLQAGSHANGVALAIMLLAINLGEYVAHRWHLHVRRFPTAVYRRHVLEHHAFFSHEHMAIAEWRDLHWVLFPPWALPLLIASVLPFIALLRLLALPHFGWLLLLAAFCYYGVYELTHVLTHLPDTHPLARSAVARAFACHHPLHHDPARMRRWNFNFAVPLFDWLFRTRWRSD